MHLKFWPFAQNNIPPSDFLSKNILTSDAGRSVATDIAREIRRNGVTVRGEKGLVLTR